MITNFENFNIPDLKAASNEFWKMTTVVNWKKVIVDYCKIKDDFFNNKETNEKRNKVKELAKKRLVLKYEYSEVKRLYKEYEKIYVQLYNYFSELDLGVSDDGYWDLLSSVIGSGKRFTKKCINEPKVLVDMAKNYEYVENFEYVINMDENDYNEIRDKYDPFFRDVRKYNM